MYDSRNGGAKVITLVTRHYQPGRWLKEMLLGVCKLGNVWALDSEGRTRRKGLLENENIMGIKKIKEALPEKEVCAPYSRAIAIGLSS